MSKDNKKSALAASQIIYPIEKLLELMWSEEIVSIGSGALELSKDFDVIMNKFLKLTNYEQLKIWHTKIENNYERVRRNKFMEGKIIPEIFRAIDDIAKTMTSSADITQMKTLFEHKAAPIFEQIKKWENAVYQAKAKSDPEVALRFWSDEGAKQLAGDMMVPLNKMLAMVLDKNNSYVLFETNNQQFTRLKEKFLALPKIIQDKIWATKIDPQPLDKKVKIFVEQGQTIPDILRAFNASSQLIKNFLKGREEYGDTILFFTSLHNIADFGKELSGGLDSAALSIDVGEAKEKGNEVLLMKLQLACQKKSPPHPHNNKNKMGA